MYGNQLVVISTTIPNGAAVPVAAADLSGLDLVGIEMPGSWTAASLTFQAAGSAIGNVANMYDSGGSEYTVTAAASRFIAVPPADFIGIKYLIVRSGTSGSPVNQGADRIINLICRDLK
jgi:hypothetical protein